MPQAPTPPPLPRSARSHSDPLAPPSCPALSLPAPPSRAAAEAHLAAKADSLHPRPAAPPPDFLAVLKDVDVKGFRALASEITALGAKLSDGLKAEAEVLREARLRAVQRADRLDLSQVEGAVREAIGDTRDKLDELRRAVAELSEREGGLAAKLAKRQQEVKRAEERLETLQDVRPVYMDEYEKMEGELQSIFITYLERHRNLAFLEAELERHREAEEAAAAEHRRALLEMQRKFQAEEMEVLRGAAPRLEDAPGGNGAGARGGEEGARGGGAGDSVRRSTGLATAGQAGLERCAPACG